MAHRICIKQFQSQLVDLSSQIASIHESTLSESFLSLLGFDFLRTWYQYQLVSEGTDLFVDNQYLSSSTLTAFLIIKDPSCVLRFNFAIRKFFFDSPNLVFSVLFSLLSKFMLNPLAFLRILTFRIFSSFFNYNFSLSPHIHHSISSCSIVSICVSNTAQSNGLGTDLISAALNYLSLKADSKFLLATTTSLQRSAINFYSGFRKSKVINILCTPFYSKITFLLE